MIIGGPLVILPRELQISQLQISQLIASETKSPLRARNFISNLNVGRRRNKKRHQDRYPSSNYRHKQGKRMKRREFLKVRRRRPRRERGCRARDRAINARSEVAAGRRAGQSRSIRSTVAANISAKRVADITDNNFQIQPFAAGEIVPGLQVLDAVSNGTVEMGNTALYYYWGKNPASHFRHRRCRSASTPAAHISWLLCGGGPRPAQRPAEGVQRASAFRPASTGAQMGGWFRKEIKSMADFQGLKFRVGGFAGTIIAKVGGVPQQIAAGDIYPALEKGTIDAAEWVGPYDDEKLGFVKVAKYYYYPGWWEGTGQGHNVVNLDKWNALPKSYQAAVESASSDSFTWVTGKYDYVNPPALKRLMVAGAILTHSRRRCWRPATAPPTRSTRISPRATRISTRCMQA